MTINIDANPATKLDKPYILTSEDEFTKELAAKLNSRFKDNINISLNPGKKGYVSNVHILKRLAISTTILYDTVLKSHGLSLITPLQSEEFLMQGLLPLQGKYLEDLALTLYIPRNYADLETGKIANYIEALSMYESIKSSQDMLELNNSSIHETLIIINAGLKLDPTSYSSKGFGVKPVIIPGISEVYVHKTLSCLKGQENGFSYGLEHGLPSSEDLERKGPRKINAPVEDMFGLRVLFRNSHADLNIGNEFLASNNPDMFAALCKQRYQKL